MYFILFHYRRAILGNPDVLYSTPWKHIVQNDFWGTPLVDSGSHGSYRPLCVLSFKLNHLFDGFKPFGYHLVNVLLHCLATGLVVKVARHVLQSVWGTIVTGALFASHPIHTEAVAGVKTINYIFIDSRENLIFRSQFCVSFSKIPVFIF